MTAMLALTVQARAQISQSDDFVPGEVIVKLKKDPRSDESQKFFGKVSSQKGMVLKRSWSGINMHKFSAKSQAPQSVKELIEELKNDPEVEYAEPNYYVRRLSVGEPQVLSESEVAAMSATVSATSYSQNGAPIDIDPTWVALSPNNSKPIVAIIDTGVDYNHRVFTESQAIWRNPLEVAGNGIDDDGNGYIDDTRGWNFVSNNNSPWDDDGHGTHVAGIVLGATVNIAANPVAISKIKIMPLKFLGRGGSGTTSDAIEAIYYAANNGAKVLNNSWGGGSYSQSLVDAIAYSYSKKVVFVAAAGNAGSNNDASPTYPSSYTFDHLIAVAATYDWDLMAGFSNYGANSVHIGSPGVGIYSTLPNNTFGYMNGTSMATPLVSGVAAMMLYEKSSMNGYQIKELLLDNGDTIASLATKTTTGHRLNAYDAVMAAKSTPVDAYMPAYDSSVNASRAPASMTKTKAAGCGTVAKIIWDQKNGGGPGGANPMRTTAFFGLLLILIAPIMLNIYLRNRDPKNKRAHTRYVIDSSVRVKVGGRELTGQISTISMGGAQLNTQAMLEQGGIVTMQIASPDGKDVINVEGKIVWSDKEQQYGVQFQNAQESVLQAISRWTQSLIRS
jgi:subtilisin family serine protease